MRLFDSHAHYDDPKFDGERDKIIAEIFAAGVERVVNASSDLATSRASIALAEKYPRFYAAIGIHPHECAAITDENAATAELCKLLGENKVVALGEIGLDYHYDSEWKEAQKHWFDAQLSIAEERGLPVIVHDREAHGDCLDIVRAHKASRGVFHSFSGSAETARELVSLGWYVSFSGSVTFKNASKLLEAVRAVPSDRLLIETDCPYLAPVPMRGKLNRSDYMLYTARAVSEARGVSEEEIAETTFRNAESFFGI